MKTVVYITKNKIWVGEKVFDWNGMSMDEVFGRVKREMKVSGVRVVFGHDVSFVTATKAGKTFLNREYVLNLIKPWMPFEIDNECFDWKSVTLGYDEVWIQIVALEKELLYSLISAVKKHGIKIDLISTIGVILAEKTTGREAPAVIKWYGKESLFVLAVNGLADIVVSDIDEKDLMIYAIQKWGLAVNPEEIILNESDFDLVDRVFSEKTKGEDRLILNIPILKEIVSEEKSDAGFVSEVKESKKEKKVKKHLWWWLGLLILIAVIVCSGVIYYTKSAIEVPVDSTPSPTTVITPEPTAIDLKIFQVKVLNGSGVTGEAASIKTRLLGSGFGEVDIGNTTATTEGMIASKVEVPEMVITTALDSVEEYKMGSPITLTVDDKYDLVIVVGSAKKYE